MKLILIKKKIETIFDSNSFPRALTLSEFLEKICEDRDLKQRKKPQNLVFPSGLGYDKQNDRVRTPKVKAIFGSIRISSKKISNIKKGETILVNEFSDLVTQTYSSSYFLNDIIKLIKINFG